MTLFFGIFVRDIPKGKQLFFLDMANLLDINSKENFGTFYNTYYKRLFRYALYYVNDRYTAEDMVHDAILYYWEHKEKIPDKTDRLGYIIMSIKNKCLDYLKHLQIELKYNNKQANLEKWEIDIRISTLEDEAYGLIFSKDIMDIVNSSLSTLPDQTQKIFILNRFENKSRKDIASLLGVSQQKIDYHINKVNRHFFNELKDYLPLLLFFI